MGRREKGECFDAVSASADLVIGDVARCQRGVDSEGSAKAHLPAYRSKRAGVLAYSRKSSRSKEKRNSSKFNEIHNVFLYQFPKNVPDHSKKCPSSLHAPTLNCTTDNRQLDSSKMVSATFFLPRSPDPESTAFLLCEMLTENLNLCCLFSD